MTLSFRIIVAIFTADCVVLEILKLLANKHLGWAAGCRRHGVTYFRGTI
jgi:hypothetical protein